MRIVKIVIKNIGSNEELEINPGAVTIFSGMNGTGKTSALNAIVAALKSPGPALIRHGAEFGSVFIQLSDPAVSVERTIKPDKSVLKVIGADGFEVKKPQSYIDSIVDAFANNPTAFILADKKERIKCLLDTVDLAFTEKQKSEIRKMPSFSEPMFNRPPLDMLELYRKSIFDERTYVNRELKTKVASCNELKRTLPNVLDPIDYDSTISELEVIVDSLEQDRDDELKSAETEFTEEAKSAEEVFKKHQAKRRAEYDAKCEEIRGKFGASITKEKESLSALRQQEKNADIQRNTHAAIEKTEKEIADCEDSERVISAAIKRIEEIKVELCKNLPCGLVIKDVELYLGNVEFDSLNTAKQYEIGVELSVEKAKAQGLKLPLVYMDRTEALDEVNFDRLKETAAQSGLQFFIARVTNEPELTIETE